LLPHLILPSFFLPTNVVHFVLVLADLILPAKRTGQAEVNMASVLISACLLHANEQRAVNNKITKVRRVSSLVAE
jgi:hypothetical protein